jgi:cob(I)alamin adenosyltransferase
MSTGLIHIYTGTGKGKSTAAVGLCNRAVGHELKACYVTFHKNPEKYGYKELDSLRELGVTVLHFAKGHPHLDPTMDNDVIKQETQEGLKTVQELITSDSFDVVVLDEILISVRDKYLDESELLQFIQQKPKNTELVLTGRGATPKVLELADYVSDIN